MTEVKIKTQAGGVNLRNPASPYPAKTVIAVLNGDTVYPAFKVNEMWYRVLIEGYVISSVVTEQHVIDTSDPLTMKYDSQHQTGALANPSDCGWACLSMLLRFYLGLEIPIDTLARWGSQGGWSTDLQIITAASHYGLVLKPARYAKLSDVPIGSILLLDYEFLKREHVQDVNYDKNHWCIWLGFKKDGEVVKAVVMDSNFWGSRIHEGDHKEYDFDEFAAAVRPWGSALVAIVKG